MVGGKDGIGLGQVDPLTADDGGAGIVNQLGE
jgi:hypothetical protein